MTSHFIVINSTCVLVDSLTQILKQKSERILIHKIKFMLFSLAITKRNGIIVQVVLWYAGKVGCSHLLKQTELKQREEKRIKSFRRQI